MLVIVAVVVALVVVRFVIPAGTPRIRPAGKAGPAKSIARLEKLNIGGSDQWVLQRSENIDNPIILFLHGGPGTSQLTGNRRNTRELEKSFIVVNWDQRGAGKSYGAIHDAAKMNIDQFVEDTKELTLYLLEKFGKRQIVLAGHSWGSAIGAMAVAKYPELYSCYVGIGQIANMEEGEVASYGWTLEQAKKRNVKRAVKALEKMGPPPYQGDWRAKTISERSYVARFGGEVHGSRLGAVGIVLGNVLFSREYGLADRINVFRGVLASMKHLWPQLFKVDLFSSVPEMKVPVFFMEGRYDREVPPDIAARYFAALKAPAKELIWFENSAHMVNSEERDLFNKILVEKVRPIALAGNLG
ncbi:MAG: alpha/beta hydrolase [Candidatus Aminicenantes bacterium]|nr:alpha/beta hydrolase [Candidatus Aminicenantes bacterium]